MDYRLDGKTIKWARTRCDQLLSAEINIGNVVERGETMALAIREACDQMDDQPESDMFRSLADDLERLFTELKDRHLALAKDRIALGRAICKYEEGVEK